jgi:hypothetical protein
MGSTLSIKKLNFEDVQYVQKTPNQFLLLNTLSESEQECLIVGTIQAANEEAVINRLLNQRYFSCKIIVYGRNCNDHKCFEKYQKLVKFGFVNVHLYTGGLFEWLMLQDIYGIELFPTTKKELDFVKYKSPSILHGPGLLEYR